MWCVNYLAVEFSGSEIFLICFFIYLFLSFPFEKDERSQQKKITKGSKDADVNNDSSEWNVP